MMLSMLVMIRVVTQLTTRQLLISMVRRTVQCHLLHQSMTPRTIPSPDIPSAWGNAIFFALKAKGVECYASFRSVGKVVICLS